MFMAETKGTEDLDKELASLSQEKAPAAVKGVKKATAAKPRKKAGAAKVKIVTSKGKRKEAIARASLRPGTGRLVINKVNISFVKPKELRDLITEPIGLTSVAKEIANSSDISVRIKGGGQSGQAQAARTAIANAILKASGSNETLRKAYMDYDRTILIDDYRRVEPKKFKGPKARARFQKSYR